MDVVFTLGSLLFEHDRVIVNGLGVFTTEIEKAYIHPVEHSFTPEFKKIKFQSDENARDDLLINALGNESAKAFIDDFVKDVQHKLKEGNKVQLKNIGFLYTHHTGEIILEQDRSFNYVKKNFGLQGFIQEPHQKNAPVAAPIAAAVPKKETKKPRIGRYFLWLAAILIALFAFWKIDAIREFFNKVPGKTFVEHKPDKASSEDVVNIADNGVDEQKTLIISSDSVSESEKAEPLSEEQEDGVEDAKQEQEVVAEVEEPKPEAEVVKHEGPRYYVIAGCFRSEFKAKRLLDELKSEGFQNASIEGTTPNGLIRVCYATYPKRRQASNYMLKLQGQGRKGVWIQKDK